MKNKHIVFTCLTVIILSAAYLIKTQYQQSIAIAHTQVAHARAKKTQPMAAPHQQAMKTWPQPAKKIPAHRHLLHQTAKAKPVLQATSRAGIIQQEQPKPDLTYLPQSRLFSSEYLETQAFNIPSDRDTAIVAKEGMRVSVPAQAFADASGKPVSGRILLQVKEAFTPSDIVLANLVTKKGNALLESGGMYYLNAVSNNQSLSVAPGRQLTVEVPTPKKEAGMELYKGLQTDKGLDWTEPVAMNDQQLALKTKSGLVSETAVANNGRMLSDRKMAKRKDGKAKVDSLGWMPLEGFNAFDVDTKIIYVMNTNRMGWANIDRLYHDPRSRQVQFVTTVEKGFEKVYTSMIFKSRRIYLPGYQKADGTYSFTHGDYEEPVLPVGEDAIVMVSAYKNGQQYFSMQPVKIADVMKVDLVPQLMKEEDIKAQINNSL